MCDVSTYVNCAKQNLGKQHYLSHTTSYHSNANDILNSLSIYISIYISGIDSVE